MRGDTIIVTLVGNGEMIRIGDLVSATSAQLIAGDPAAWVQGFCFDSRLARPEELFVAVVTDTGDGHAHIQDALRQGVTAVMCQRAPEGQLDPSVSWLLVDNSQQALLDYAGWVLAERQVAVIGITGSLGKSSTKEAVAAVLAAREPVFRNPGSYNGRYGLPIALGGLQDEKLAVLEMAADSLDEIRLLARLTHPQVGIVTAIGHSHVADLGGLDEIAREKARLVEALPADGLAVLNGDDARTRAMAELCSAAVVTVGVGTGNTYRLEDIATGLEGTTCVVAEGDGRVPLRLPWLGLHHAYTMGIAYAVGRHYGLDPSEIAARLATAVPLPGRLVPLRGLNQSQLLDDTFSASPESFASALRTLQALPARRRWVIAGDMSDLGGQSESLHRQVGSTIASVADRLVAKGDMAAWMASQALRDGMDPSAVHVAYTDRDVLTAVQARLEPGDVVLVKGSAAGRLENITAGLMAEPAEAAQRLVRQSRGWQSVQLRQPGRPTWVEVDLDAIAHNTRLTLQRLRPGTQLMAVLKADAYGHGARRVARTVLASGATWLGVACLGEAIELRSAGIQAPILNLGYTPAWQARDAVRHGVVSTVYSVESGEALARAGRDLGRPAVVHVKLDTGMARLGVTLQELLPLLRSLSAIEGLTVGGLFSHLATADAADPSYTDEQLRLFAEAVCSLRAENLLPSLVHIANSAATLKRPESHYDMVRPGILLYGLAPSEDTPLPAGYRPALSFKCQVAQVKTIPAGACVGYGCTFRASRPMRIAVLPVGYADGFRRAPRNWGHVLLRGRPAPLVGRVCMDQCMVDVTDIPGARQGDEVVLIGSQGGATLTAEAVAEQLGTINYEVVSEILARVPRLV
ncbi:MAG: alanine racemase [Chloroflexi bacterium]|nr:alanine racemase [Chloroflexota bacterium]